MWKQVFSYRMLVTLLMGYAAGVPLLLIGSTMQAWMTESGVNLTVIGMSSLIGLPYSLKFLWSPLIDRFPLWPSRRRGWMALSQLGLVAALLVLSQFNPALQIEAVVITAIVIAFLSSTQDITIDSYRREILSEEELGLGSSLYVVGYRIGILVAGAGALLMADHWKLESGGANWALVYQMMALAMAVGLVITLIAPKEDPKLEKPKTLQEAVVGPFVEFFKRDGALMVLGFILLYKVGDSMAANMTTPFMLLKGYTKTDIATVVKGLGLIALICGGILGGIGCIRWGNLRALWVFGFLQAVSTAGFCFLSLMPVSMLNLSLVIGFENFSAGLGTSAYSAFMASMTNKKFTATQYALLTALMAVPRTLLSSPTGWMAEKMGWELFFVFCTVIALPGMALIPLLTRKTAGGSHSASVA
ncbi:MAG: AmpG family muropeptide MFS transporter [Bacteriovoracia bacterium]